MEGIPYAKGPLTPWPSRVEWTLEITSHHVLLTHINNNIKKGNSKNSRIKRVYHNDDIKICQNKYSLAIIQICMQYYKTITVINNSKIIINFYLKQNHELYFGLYFILITDIISRM